MNKTVTILDYGMCNLLNVARAFQHIGTEVLVTGNPIVAARADRLVVPGVGAFEDSVREILAHGFDNVIRDFVSGGRPFLGICVGMQMLFDASEEFGEHRGLGILPGRVEAVPKLTTQGEKQRVPHIGWSHLVEPVHGRSWDSTLLEGHKGSDPAMYFVHSYAANPEREADRLADCMYGGHRICAAIKRDNIMATQFHPERSGEIGLNVLRSFVKL